MQKDIAWIQNLLISNKTNGHFFSTLVSYAHNEFMKEKKFPKVMYTETEKKSHFSEVTGTLQFDWE